jgi:hypothetical protein
VEARLIAALCVLAAARVLFFSAAFPFFSNVDELAHVDLVVKYSRGYVPSRPVERYDTETARLFGQYQTLEYVQQPARFPTGFPRPLWEAPPEVASRALESRVAQLEERINHEVHSPPSYYALAGLGYRLGKSLGLSEGQGLYWIRFLNAPLIALLVWLAYRFCRSGCPDRPDLRLGVPLVLAFLPQDVFYSVNSDVLSPVLFTASLIVLLSWWRRDTPEIRWGVLLGLLVAATFLVKFTNIVLVLVFGLALVLTARRPIEEGRTSRALVTVAPAALAALLPAGTWLLRNLGLFGDLSGMGPKLDDLGWTRRPAAEWLSHPIFTPRGFWTFWDGLLRTLWRGELVWYLKRIASPVADGFYTLSSTVSLIAAGTAWGVERRRAARPDAESNAIAPAGPSVGTDFRVLAWASVVLSVLCLGVLSISFDYNRSFYPSRTHPYFTSGRLMAGALVPFLFLWVEGLSFLLGGRDRVKTLLVVLALICLAITVSEVLLTRPVLGNPYNWFHIP